jgi:hypothetical protein
MNPFRYRPPPVDPNDGETDEWEDNAISNFMAWGSRTFLPKWCDTPEHWTSRLSGYFHTSCPCCLWFRGVIVGIALTIFLDIIIAAVLMVIYVRS